MYGIMQDGMGAVREEERGHARDHAGWKGSSEERRTGSYREVLYRIMQAWIEAVRGEEKDHAGYHA